MTTTEKTICFFNSNKVWGGGEKWHYEFSQRLLKEGYRVFAVTNHKSDLFLKLQATSIPILPLKINNLSFLNPLKIIRLCRFFKKNDIHVVILGLSSDVKLGGIASKFAGLNKIIYRRGSAVPVKNSLLNRLIFKYVLTGVIVNSLEVKRALLQNNPNLIEPDKIHLLYNCINVDNFSIPAPFNKYQKKKDGEVWLGNVGRLVDQKGQKFLIDLAKKLKEKNIKFKLLIAGKGNLEHSLKEQAITLDLEKEIIFLGFVPDMCSFMNTIDIFLLASLHEGSANVLLEAMACSKPVVAFEVSSISEIVEHNYTGFLAEFKNVQDFSDRVQCLIEDSGLRLQMGMNGKRRIEEKFKVAKVMQDLLNIIN
jgi:glycosyltransferase involved in cell wall biosynthesis